MNPKMPRIKKGATPDEIRKFLHTKIDVKADCYDPENDVWISPLTGETFDSFYALSGHLGAYTRTINPTPLTEDRRGYTKALRRGVEPTEAQRDAHKKYMREHRRKLRAVKRKKRS